MQVTFIYATIDSEPNSTKKIIFFHAQLEEYKILWYAYIPTNSDFSHHDLGSESCLEPGATWVWIGAFRVLSGLPSTSLIGLQHPISHSLH